MYQGFTFDYKAVIKELWRVTKPGGVVVWVVGDAVIKGSESGTSFRQALAFIEAGFRLHDTMIYEKNGAAYPASEKSNRYSQVFEFMFIFSKGAPKTHNLICDKKNKWAGWGTFGKNSERQGDGTIKKRGEFVVKDFSPRNNIWKINNGYGYTTKDKWAYEHPAMFPEELALDHIKTWSNPNDLVLDPMAGAGTTLKAAKQLGRNYIGIDISPEYVKLAERRVNYGTILTDVTSDTEEGHIQASGQIGDAWEPEPVWLSNEMRPPAGISSTDNKKDVLEGNSDGTSMVSEG